MGRYIKDVELNQPIDVVSLVMEDYIYHNHFSRTDWNGEMVYYLKDGHGGERYLKWSYAGGVYHVEAWLKGVFGNEMDLDGVGGGASRREFRESMDQLVEQLKRQQASALAGGHVGADPLHHDTDYQAEHRAWKEAEKSSTLHRAPSGQESAGSGQGAGDRGRPGTWDSGKNTGLLPGILGVIFGAAAPVLGIVLGIMCVKRYSGTGRMLGILAIVLAVAEILFWVLSYILYPVMLL